METTSPESRDRLRQTSIDEINSFESSARALKSRHNQLVPISRLPCEVLSAIFSLLPVFAWNEGSGHLAWICVAHVCRRWRETALNYPHFWSYINLTKLTPVGMAEILSRAKMAPLHLEVCYTERNAAHFEAFERQLDAHISHTRYLKFSGHLSNVVKRLVPPVPTLESLSLSHKYHPNAIAYGTTVTTLDDLFNCTAPNLTSLKLENCDIDWKSPLLKGLRILELNYISGKASPELDDWLDALNEMPQLKELSLQFATPIAAPDDPLVSRTVTLPSLTHFHINSMAEDCALALAHLLLPTLTWLHIDAKSRYQEGEDVRPLIPYVARNAYVLQAIEPIRSVLVAGERTCAEVLTWTTPSADVKVCGPDSFNDMSRSACLVFTAKAFDRWNYGVNNTILDALLTLLPMNSVSTFTAQNHTRLSKEFWLRHSSRMPLLEQARLVPTSVRAFGEMLVEDVSLDSDGPQFPMLTKLILLDVRLSAMRVIHLRNILMERVEQGVALDSLDLRTCNVANCAIQLLTEIVVDVQRPLLKASPISMTEFLGSYHGDYNEVGFADWRYSWYDDIDNGEDEEDGDEDDDDDEDEDDDEDDDDDDDTGYSW